MNDENKGSGRHAPTREQIGRILYECEKKRGDHADAVMKGISPKASDALLMEPWDECKDSFLSDADAVLGLFPSTAMNETPTTLCGQIASIYGSLDPEDCARVDRQWMKMRKIPAPPSPDTVREALVKAQDAISKLAYDALGYGEDDAGRWPLRDELLQTIDTALSSAPVAGATVPKRLLDERDNFIVSKGLWTEFTDTLPRNDRSTH